MFNIVNFQQQMLDESSLAYNIYKKLNLQNLLETPLIYTDMYTFRPNNIAIFPTYYMREQFRTKYILLDYADYEFVPEYLQKSCIVIYNELFHNPNDIDCYLKISTENDAVEIIKENLK